ncbi:MULTISPECIES: hypothetical protein [Oleiagrimonas]|jgi:hypothetical protein|uniref:Uncharacterized protein n=1 Tax=Oleiagrimonas citrea TaxID=1665687 RepID=A0A846ZIW2_9GAMM|nr:MULTISPECIES: hypothetical protein [Oleiagrimonas]NKZ37946.1 hypothetical protein [Oleiagrimonas citrea]RAP57439.1 hypothetical protein BTJ49_10235 [Oleiagrimonas sp. MCCC 1A03011]
MKTTSRLLALIAIPALLLGTASLAMADPPPWAPAHGYRAKHHYVYYPNGEIYYAPERRMWFWLSGDDWQAGVTLPSALRAYVRVGGVNIDLDATRPYERHTYVVNRYGGHQVRWHHRDRYERRHRYDRDDQDRDDRHGHHRY